jgi:predicted permease
VKRFFRWPHGASEIDTDVKREIEFHLEEHRRELAAQGLPPASARAAASEAFGDRMAIETEVRMLRTETVRARQRRGRWDDLRQDLHIALRGLRRTPAFTAVALLTLALGIGANSAVFSVVDSVLFRPLPYPGADRLVQLWTDHRGRNGRVTPEWLTPPDFADWHDQNTTFASMATYQNWGPILTGSGEPESLTGLAVSGDFFNVLGIAPAIGRAITPADDTPDAEPVVVLGHALWQAQFGGDRTIINRQIELNGQSWRVVGVMPPTFRAPVQGSVLIFRPVRRPATGGCGRGCIVLRAVGRLKPGITLAQAQGDIGAIARRQAQDYPATNQGVGAWLIGLHEQIAGPTERPLLALSGAVALVLLIACVNVASLLLLRGAARGRELSVRVALGAGRRRLLRQLMTESALLAGAGGILGLGIAAIGCQWLAAAVPPLVREIQGIGVNPTVIAFTAAISLVSGVVFGLLPALKSTDHDLMGLLRSGVREVGVRRNQTQHILVAAQLAIAVMLLVGAGLLIRSLAMMERVDLGYRTDGVLLDAITFPASRYPDPRITLTTNTILDQLRASPAIRAAEVTDQPPLSTGDQDVTAIAVGEPRRGSVPGSIWYRVTSPGYLPLMHVHLVEGRYFDQRDRNGSASVGIVNAEAVRKLWGGKSPLGRVLATGEDSTAPHLTIVGIVATDRQDGPNQPPKAELFIPLGQIPANGFSIVVEPTHNAADAVSALRAAIHGSDPLLPFARPAAIEEIVRDVVALPRLYAILIGVFAAAALALAVIGVYGVMAYAVAQRQREIGVRLALGASPASIRGLVLWGGVRLAAIGTAVGLLGATALGHLLGSLLFGVSTTDLATYLAVPLVLGATAFLACWVPARRAMRIDPILAIRQE